MKKVTTKYGIMRSRHVFQEGQGNRWFWVVKFFSGKQLQCYSGFLTKEDAISDMEREIKNATL